MLSAGFYPSWKEADPVEYQKFRAQLREGIRNGMSLSQAQAFMATHVTVLFLKYIPETSDALAVELAKTFTASLNELGRENPEACYAWLFPGNTSEAVDVDQYLTKEDLQTISDVLGRVIVDASSRKARVPKSSEMADPLAKIYQQMRMKDGSQAEVLANLDAPTNDHALVCKLTTDLYEAVLSLPVSQQGPVVRYMFSGQ